MSLWKKFALPFASLAVCGIPLAAQTPPTCATAPPSVTNLSIERVLTLSNILTTFTPNIPASLLTALTAGGQEVRSRIIYNPTQNTVTDTTFFVNTGAPLPTPIGLDITGQTIQGYTLNVDRVYTSCTPVPNILFVGMIGGGFGPFGNFSGTPAAISIGYTTDNPPKINNVVELIAGTAVAYSAGASGALTFPPPPPPPPTGPVGAPTIVLNPKFPTAGSTQVFQNPLPLDATGTTDPNKLALTYAWTSDKPASFNTPNIANPILTFQSGSGDYKITLTVTNSAGVMSSTSFTLTYINK